MAATYSFTAELWAHDGPAAWYFVSLPGDLADDLTAATVGSPFGSRRVEATIGGTRWSTSVFPDSKRSTFVLPVKQSVRRAEDLDDGALVEVTLRLLDPG